MRRWLPLLAAVPVAAWLAGGGCSTDHATPDSPLHVVSSTPANGDLDVDVNVTLEVIFSVAVAPESVEDTGQIVLQDEGLAIVPAVVKVDTADPTRVTVNPTQALLDDATYGLAIRHGVATPDGHRLAAPLGVKFSTGTTLAPMNGWPPFDNPALPPQAAGTFLRATNEMSVGRQDAAGAVLNDGRVFVHGGRGTAGGALGTADVYRPLSNDFALAGAGGAPVARWGHTATLLPDGTVLLVGGDTGSTILADTPLFSPATDSYPVTALTLATARTAHTATALTDGRVLVVGGWSGTAALSSCELYDPTGGTWSTVGALTAARAWHAATLLADGRVLVTGGGTGTAALSANEIYDPNTATWTATGSLNAARQYHTATLLVSGSAAGLVIVCGGEQPGGTGVLASAALFDPAGNAGAGNVLPLGASLGTARAGHTATFLPATGGLLIAGGSAAVLPATSSSCQPLKSAELFDPFGSGTALGTGPTGVVAQATFSATTDSAGNTTVLQGVAIGRGQHLAFAVTGGAVFLVGGFDCTSGNPYSLPTGERYQP